jgi:cytochrome c
MGAANAAKGRRKLMAQARHWFRYVAVVGLAVLLLACGGGERQTATPDGVDAPTNTAAQEARFAASMRGANLLIFSRTAGFRHQSIGAGLRMFDELAAKYGFAIVKTEDPAVFSDAQIGAFDAVVFLNTTGDVLNDAQQRAFERYIQSGGGYVGIHAAADTEIDGSWPWYIRLVGGTFAGHPMNPSNVQQARLSVVEGAGEMAEGLPRNFTFVDEWYDFNHLNMTTRPILKIDRDSYVGAIATGLERIAWYHDYDGGRVFYTNLGHEDETYSSELFRRHLLSGLVYAVGDRVRGALIDGRPDPDRFAKDVLIESLDEPISLDVRPDGSILVIERPGRIKLWREGKDVENVGQPPNVYYPGGNSEFGLLALATVPHDREAPMDGAYVMYNLMGEDDQILQRLAYVPFRDGQFDFGDERTLFDIPTDPNCCHTGGAVRFGPDGYLYVAVGDNSNPHELDGFAPLSTDDLARDARRTAGNTQDLRGKILRIAPSADGSYEIPAGNLFADAEQGRPEIYVMGARNPYTIGFDAADGALYFGDVGPDARTYTDEGPRGYDEINRVTEAGNFGWPFFIGDNRPYYLTERAEGRPRRLNNPLAPENDSPRNTGPRHLPPAQPALIWYPYTVSERFPEMGAGGRNALVAGVYRRPPGAVDGDGAWPSFFEGQLIISEFMRRYLKAVTINETGEAAKITSIAEDIELSGPLDIQFGPDGALYVIEYGTRWFTGNDDARLSRVRYTGSGNRAPRLAVGLDRVAGALPFNVSAEALNAIDPDGDDFTIEWAVAPIQADATGGDYAGLFGEAVAMGDTASFTIDAPGRHVVIARAKDSKGATSYSHAYVDAGNEPPHVSIEIEGNRSFFWPGRQTVDYRVMVSDAEDGSTADGSISAERIVVRASTESLRQPPAPVIGHQTAAEAAGPDSNAAALALLTEHTCTSCHQIDRSSIGPTYADVAARYADQSEARAVLEASLLEGSAGKWGDQPMAPFDYVSADDRAAMVDFILSLHDRRIELPVAGSVVSEQFISNDDEFVLLTAQYTDDGAGDAPSLTGFDEVRLRSNVVSLAALFTAVGERDGVRRFTFEGNEMLIMFGTGATLPMGELDLTGLSGVNVHWAHDSEPWGTGRMRVELREGSPDGAVLAAAPLDIAPGGGQQTGEMELGLVDPVDGMRPLFMRVVPVEGISDDTQVAFVQAVFEPRTGG